MEFTSSLNALDSLVGRLAACWGKGLIEAKEIIQNDADYKTVKEACEFKEANSHGL